MFYWPLQGGASFVDHFCYLCFVFVVISCLCGHLLGKWLAFGSLVCDVIVWFVTFQCGVLGQVWCLIVSIPDLSLLAYFSQKKTTFDD